MKTLLAALMFSGLLCAQSKFRIQVLVAPDGGYATTSTIIYGQRDAILIDPQFTRSEAKKVAATIKASGKNLTTVYVTHGHPDHYFGLAVMKEEFPQAKLVALPEVVPQIEKGWAGRREYWLPTYGEELPSATPVLPEPLAKPELTLEGEVFPITGGMQGDAPGNSFVWVPSLKAVIAGDIIFNHVHFSQPADPAPLLASLAKIEALKPEILVGGHAKIGEPNTMAAMAWMRQYLKDFTAFKAESKSAAELKAKMLAKYPEAGMVSILDREAGKVFPAADAKGK